jgi:S-adenosylmethionine-diacylgycerolhomoserine-N-methlytransferase
MVGFPKFDVPGRKHLIGQLRPGPAEAVLEIGCGSGGNLIRAARQYPYAVFFGIDASAARVARAGAAIERAGLAARITVAKAEIAQPDFRTVFRQATFERVFISFGLSRTARWENTLDGALNATERGGELHLADFGAMNMLPGGAGAALRQAMVLFGVTPRERLEACLAKKAHDWGAEVEFAHLYRQCVQYARVKMPA